MNRSESGQSLHGSRFYQVSCAAPFISISPAYWHLKVVSATDSSFSDLHGEAEWRDSVQKMSM